jgi:hypothetical protein
MEITPEIQRWLNNRVNGCYKRALNRKSQAEWRRAIKKAIAASDGVCPYTGVTLDFGLPSYDPFYPSLDHKKGLDSTDLGITTRIVNDMKSIMSEGEFLKMVTRIYEYRVARVAPADPHGETFKPRRAFKKAGVKF